MASDWQRALIALSATVVGSVSIAVLYWGRWLFIPVALAIYLTFVLVPVVARLQRLGLGRTLAVIATVGIVLLLSLGIGTIIVQQVSQLIETLPDHHETIKAKLLAAKHWLVGAGQNRFGHLVDEVSAIIAPQPGKREVVVEHATPLSQLTDYLSPAAAILGQGAFTFILTVYMLHRREDLRNRMIRILGAGKVTTTTKAVDDASHRISSYLLRQFIVNCAVWGSHCAGAVHPRRQVLDPLGVYRRDDALCPLRRHVARSHPAGALLVRNRAGMGWWMGTTACCLRAIRRDSSCSVPISLNRGCTGRAWVFRRSRNSSPPRSGVLCGDQSASFFPVR